MSAVWFALVLALGSVVLGALLGLAPRVAPLGRFLRTFAVVAAVALVLGQIIPDALSSGGLWVLAVALCFFVVPTVLERLSHRLAFGDPEKESRWVLELGFFGLLAHKVGDGVAVGAYTGGVHSDHLHLEVYVAIAAHTVPIVAVMVAAFRAHLGVRAAWFRTVWLLLAVAFGVLATGSLFESVLAPFEPWILAAVGGLLLHVVSHAHGRAASAERTFPLRAQEFLAMGLGIALLLLTPEHGHIGDGGHGGHGGRGEVLAAFWSLLLESAPALLAGLAIGAALQLWGALIPIRWLTGGSSLGQALRAAAVGIPIPICSCGVLPVVESLRRRGATAAVLTSFLLAAPELGVETFALTVRFFGWPFAILRLLAALLVAVLAAVTVAAMVRRRSGEAPTKDAPVAELYVTAAPAATMGTRFLSHFHDLLAHIGPWTLLGLLVAAYTSVAASGTESALTTGSLTTDLVVVTLLAIPSYVCAASATPLAAVLVMQGFSPGAALLGLLLGPATNVATFGYLSQTFGLRTTLAALASLVACGWSLALASDPWLRAQSVLVVPNLHHHEASWFPTACVVVLLLASAIGVWRRGLGGWFGALSPLGFDGHGHHHHEHEHDHAHGDNATEPASCCSAGSISGRS